MPTITVPRMDLSTEEMVTVLRDDLGSGYNVLPGMSMGQLPFQGPREGRPDMIVVGTGDVTLVLNTFGIARTVREAVASRPRLRQAEQTKRGSPVGRPTVTG